MPHVKKSFDFQNIQIFTVVSRLLKKLTSIPQRHRLLGDAKEKSIFRKSFRAVHTIPKQILQFYSGEQNTCDGSDGKDLN